jgi:hypothetical protein
MGGILKQSSGFALVKVSKGPFWPRTLKRREAHERMNPTRKRTGGRSRVETAEATRKREKVIAGAVNQFRLLAHDL